MQKEKTKFTPKEMAYIALLVVLIAVCSWISIPSVVPFTMQTFGVFCAVGLLGGFRGTVAVLIYILPPSYEELEKRLIGRGSETPEKAKKRLHDAASQLGYAYAYDYVLVNDDLDQAVRAVENIINVSRLRTAEMKNVIDQIRQSFKEVL